MSIRAPAYPISCSTSVSFRFHQTFTTGNAPRFRGNVGERRNVEPATSAVAF